MILTNKSSKVKWEVLGTETTVLPGHLANWGADREITYAVLKSLNSGRKKRITLGQTDTHTVTYIPDAAKVLYGWEED